MTFSIKDRTPEESAAFFKQTLEKLGIRFNEKYSQWVDGAVSLALTDPQHGISVNGKGIDRAYCLASAYGEALERIQSRMSYEAAAKLSQEANDYLGFSAWPDEQLRPISAIDTNAHIAHDLGACLGEARVSRAFLSRYTGGEELAFVPYYAVNQARTVMLPDAAIGLMCGSNGLASGNTPQEALCQAFCEILERYAKFSIYKRGLTPPGVPADYIKEHAPDSAALIARMEAAHGYKITVRDASMGLGLPVINVLLVDKQNQRYFTKLGAHPCFFAALERCLTELSQGYSPGDARQDAAMLSYWGENTPNANSNRNLMDSYRSDVAYAPETFFAGGQSWEFKEWPNAEGFTNTNGVKALARLLLTLTPELYIRNTGYLGVPTYRVYAPGVSTLPIKLSEKNLRYSELHSLLCDVMQCKRELKRDEALELISAFESDDTAFGGRNDSFFLSLSPKLIHALLLYSLGEKARAVKVLDAAANADEKCVRSYITLVLNGVAIDVREALIRTFFDDAVALRVCAALKHADGALKAYIDPLGLISMLRGERAAKDEQLEKARNAKLDRLHKTLKEKMKSGMPNQMHTAAILN